MFAVGVISVFAGLGKSPEERFQWTNYLGQPVYATSFTALGVLLVFCALIPSSWVKRAAKRRPARARSAAKFKFQEWGIRKRDSLSRFPGLRSSDMLSREQEVPPSRLSRANLVTGDVHCRRRWPRSDVSDRGHASRPDRFWRHGLRRSDSWRLWSCCEYLVVVLHWTIPREWRRRFSIQFLRDR